MRRAVVAQQKNVLYSCALSLLLLLLHVSAAGTEIIEYEAWLFLFSTECGVQGPTEHRQPQPAVRRATDQRYGRSFVDEILCCIRQKTKITTDALGEISIPD